MFVVESQVAQQLHEVSGNASNKVKLTTHMLTFLYVIQLLLYSVAFWVLGALNPLQTTLIKQGTVIVRVGFSSDPLRLSLVLRFVKIPQTAQANMEI